MYRFIGLFPQCARALSSEAQSPFLRCHIPASRTQILLGEMHKAIAEENYQKARKIYALIPEKERHAKSVVDAEALIQRHQDRGKLVEAIENPSHLPQ